MKNKSEQLVYNLRMKDFEDFAGFCIAISTPSKLGDNLPIS
jgi:hypothetical protein